MEAFVRLTSLAVALDRANVDTDQIIPARFLSKPIGEQAKYAFYDLRYGHDELPEPSFPLNEPSRIGARILVARENFGCGSSREHAVWALMNCPDPSRDFSFRCVIAPSFGDIFRSNACKNGLLPVVLSASVVEAMLLDLKGRRGELTVDLEKQIVIGPDGAEHRFEFDSFQRECLLRGVEDIELTLAFEREIAAFEQRRSAEKPWLDFAAPNAADRS
jgi:3-isopropylmalate/(R)-2-methylmalate dehydratase small subunit